MYQNCGLYLVAGGGFEPPASRLWAWRATGLLHPAMGRIFRLDNYILGLGSYQVFSYSRLTA